MLLLNAIYEFFNHPTFAIIGGISTVVLVLGALYRTVLWFFGITPVVMRLGKALSRRRVAIFGQTEAFNTLKTALVDSSLFSERNITHIQPDNVDKAKKESLFLVDWDSAQQAIDAILAARKDNNTAVLIYAKPGSIPQDRMVDIANRPNTLVVNFRGRLVNDIFNFLITTNF